MVIFLPILVMLMMACNLASGTGTQAPGSTPQGGGNQPGQPGGVPQPGGTPPANPVSINDGLGSLNSYQMTVIIKSTGPDPSQSSTTTADTQHSKDADATLTHLNMSIVKKGGGIQALPIPTPTRSEMINAPARVPIGPGAARPIPGGNARPGQEYDRITPLIQNPLSWLKKQSTTFPPTISPLRLQGLG